MKPSQIKIDHSIQELFFVIAPPRHIRSDVSVLKDDVQYLIGHEFVDRHSPAHISLFKYDDESCFDDMTRHVERVASHLKPFNVFIKDLNVFSGGSSRTIYMEVVNKYPLRNVFEKVVRKDILYTPSITIAKELGADDFSKAWPYLKDLPYSQHFLCDRIVVLARIQNKWVHYKELQFAQ